MKTSVMARRVARAALLCMLVAAPGFAPVPAPDDPVEYMVWLRSRRAEGLRRSYKRIVDVEKEGIVLLYPTFTLP